MPHQKVKNISKECEKCGLKFHAGDSPSSMGDCACKYKVIKNPKDSDLHEGKSGKLYKVATFETSEGKRRKKWQYVKHKSDIGKETKKRSSTGKKKPAAKKPTTKKSSDKKSSASLLSDNYRKVLAPAMTKYRKNPNGFQEDLARADKWPMDKMSMLCKIMDVMQKKIYGKLKTVLKRIKKQAEKDERFVLSIGKKDKEEVVIKNDILKLFDPEKELLPGNFDYMLDKFNYQSLNSLYQDPESFIHRKGFVIFDENMQYRSQSSLGIYHTIKQSCDKYLNDNKSS